MKLPKIKEIHKSSSQPLISQKYKIINENSKNNSPTNNIFINSFNNKLNKVNEIKIFLSEDFHEGDVDNEFMKDIENEYAEKYLTKMEIFPTKSLINKILKLRPPELCDFHISNDILYINDKQKNVKVIHIYPNAILNNSKINKNNKSTSNFKVNENLIFRSFENHFLTSRKKINPTMKNIISNIKKNNKISKNDLVYNQDKVETLINSAKEEIIEAQFVKSKNIKIDIDLSSENIRNNYIIYKKPTKEKSENKIINGKSKFFNISKSISLTKNILNDKKYIFPITEIENLTKEILTEIYDPLETSVEVIIKDMNYLLDHFPVNDFINVGKITEKQRIEEDNKNFAYKLNVNSYNDLLEVYKILHSTNVTRLIGLTLNLIYWIVFGSSNNIQIDNNTKELIYLKILNETQILENSVNDGKILYEILMPLLIILLRLEADIYFTRKFVKLFKIKKNKIACMNLINDVITEIYDKHGYMNSFAIIAGKSKDLKDKMIKNLLPRFKEKSYATSNLIEQIFSNDKSVIFNNINNENNLNDEIEQRKKFISEQKINFISDFLKKINRNLAKRKLKPIFSIKDSENLGVEIKNNKNNSVDASIMHNSKNNISRLYENKNSTKLQKEIEKSNERYLNRIANNYKDMEQKMQKLRKSGNNTSNNSKIKSSYGEDLETRNTIEEKIFE